MESEVVESSLHLGIVLRAPPSMRPYVSTAACSPFLLCGTFRVALGDSYRTEPEKSREEDVEGWGDTAGGVGGEGGRTVVARNVYIQRLHDHNNASIQANTAKVINACAVSKVR